MGVSVLGWRYAPTSGAARKGTHMSNPRTYVVGLPVVVTVWDDGTITYEVDTSDAAAEIAASDEAHAEYALAAVADALAVEVDHNRGPLQYVSRAR